jgi:hypothetical protein
MKPAHEGNDHDLALLMRTLDGMGVEIRRGMFDGEGGLVRLGGQYVVFVREGISVGSERDLYLDALRKIGTEGVHVAPRVRELLGNDEWDKKSAGEGTVHE